MNGANKHSHRPGVETTSRRLVAWPGKQRGPILFAARWAAGDAVAPTAQLESCVSRFGIRRDGPHAGTRCAGPWRRGAGTLLPAARDDAEGERAVEIVRAEVWRTMPPRRQAKVHGIAVLVAFLTAALSALTPRRPIDATSGLTPFALRPPG
jgi:hypothetical protein